MTKHVHGGNIYTYKNCLDFSANCNPLGTPESVKQAVRDSLEYMKDYPQVGYAPLKKAIAEYEGVASESVICGNGAAELVFSLCQAVKPKKALIPVPTFAEYEQALTSCGCEVEHVLLREEEGFSLQDSFINWLHRDLDMVFLCNPNNPTSSAIMQEDLRKLIAFCADKDIFVMIDETYVEFAPDVEEITAIPLTREFTNLMVLRGVSKFYAAPGMRLGYGITGNMEFLSKMREKQTPWSLNSLGAFAGELMLRDHDYIQETRDLILDERDRMEQELQNIPTFKVYPAYANFILLKIRRDGLTSADVFEACIKKGLMIRDCSSFQCLDGEFVRFCIMMHDDNTKLLNVLKQL